MFHILRKLKEHLFGFPIWNPGYNYLLPECIVVGLPLSLDNEYELQIHWPDTPKKPVTFDIAVYEPDAIRLPGDRGGFTFEYRDDNTALVTFDPRFMKVWSAGSKQDLMFSLYDKTDDIMLLSRYRFIAKRGSAAW